MDDKLTMLANISTEALVLAAHSFALSTAIRDSILTNEQKALIFESVKKHTEEIVSDRLKDAGVSESKIRPLIDSFQ
jgi:translation initiation factor 6 (eIF-6)